MFLHVFMQFNPFNALKYICTFSLFFNFNITNKEKTNNSRHNKYLFSDIYLACYVFKLNKM